MKFHEKEIDLELFTCKIYAELEQRWIVKEKVIPKYID